MKKNLIFISLLLVLSFAEQAKCQDQKHSFAIEGGQFLYDGKVIQIHSGEMHYARVPQEYWRHRFQMMKAMGLNTVSTYVFWNYHNTAPGVWNFSGGNKNLRAFIQIAQEEGLMVILRPGPYVCAEWDFGGYPWWLQNNQDLIIRTNQPFLDSCNIYIHKLAEQLNDLQMTHGGPIIMVQVENEFGSYVSQRKDIPMEQHRTYYYAIKKMLENAGFDVPFFTSDGSWLFQEGAIPGILPTANGETNIENLKKAVNPFTNTMGPYMVGEFYPGWLDHWGEDFIRVPAEQSVQQLEVFLQNNISFNIYMVHGGTNFAFTSGANYDANRDIQPDITSYDYDAPISEAGWPTDKYMAFRSLMQKYSTDSLPAIPANIPVISIPDIQLTHYDFFDWKKSIKPIVSDVPLTFEMLGQGYGYVLYSHKIETEMKGNLNISGLRDYALVYINGKRVGELNRMTKTYSLEVDIPANALLEIFVENMGRINYGAEIPNNKKGIISAVTLNGMELRGNWNMYRIPFDSVPELSKKQNVSTAGKPAFYSGTFGLKTTGDVFLDMQSWGKGIVFINGHNLGRYWNIGPQQTLYIPACWLKKGENKVVIFEMKNDMVQKVLKATKKPILDNLKK